MKKLLITCVGIALLLLGCIFLILPGPGFLILILALTLLSMEYPLARKWLTITQKRMKEVSAWADKKLADRKRAKYEF